MNTVSGIEGTTLGSSGNFWVGSQDGLGFPVIAKLDELALFDKILPVEDITHLAAGGSPQKLPSDTIFADGFESGSTDAW